jgi:hypothetical protein
LAVIIDFGIATIRDSNTDRPVKTQVIGSLPYMAPEQFEGRPEPRSDIYALGVIAYEALTGQRPFPVGLEDFYQRKAGLKVLPRELRKDLPEASEFVILKALSWDAADRYATAEAFADALANSLAVQEVDASLQSRRFKAIALRAGYVVLALPAIIGGLAWQRLREPALPHPATPPRIIMISEARAPTEPATPAPDPIPPKPKRKPVPPPAPQQPPATQQGAAIDIDGTWSVPVRYGRAIAGGEPVWHEEYRFIVVAGGRVRGTATMFEYPYAIRDGQLDGKTLTFSVYQETSDGKEVRELQYRGEIENGRIHFVHQDMKTGKIIEFTAARSSAF